MQMAAARTPLTAAAVSGIKKALKDRRIPILTYGWTRDGETYLFLRETHPAINLAPEAGLSIASLTRDAWPQTLTQVLTESSSSTKGSHPNTIPDIVEMQRRFRAGCLIGRKDREWLSSIQRRKGKRRKSREEEEIPMLTDMHQTAEWVEDDESFQFGVRVLVNTSRGSIINPEAKKSRGDTQTRLRRLLSLFE